jgi:hypothetical protein
LSLSSISNTDGKSTALKQTIGSTEDVLKDSLAFIARKATYVSILIKHWEFDTTAKVTFKTSSSKE